MRYLILISIILFAQTSWAQFTNTHSVACSGNSGEYIRLPDAGELMQPGTNSSISFWFKLSNLASFPTLIGTFDGTIGGGAWFDATNRIRLTNAFTLPAAVNPMTDGVWHHVVITRDSTHDINMYVDGDPSPTNPSNISGDTDLNMFCRWRDSNELQGFIDEAAIWDVVLDAANVTALYNSGTPTDVSVNAGGYTNAANLKHWWRMGDGVENASERKIYNMAPLTTNAMPLYLINMETSVYSTDVP